MKTGKHAGQYQVRIQPINKLTGRRESWPVQYVKTKRAAKAVEHKMWAEYQEGFNQADGNSIFTERFRKFVDTKKQSVSMVTYRDWDYSARIFEKYFGLAKINQMTTETIANFARQFVKERGLKVCKSSAIARRLTHMRSYFQTIVGTVIRENPVPKQALSVFFRRSELDIGDKYYIFSDEELKCIKDQIASDFKNMAITSWLTRLAIWISLETGMRPEEIQALRFSDLINQEGYTTFEIHDSWSDYTKSFNGALKSRPKGVSRRCLPLSTELINTIKSFQTKQRKFLQLHSLKNPQDLIFLNIRNYKSSSKEQPINQRSINQMLAKLCDRLNITSDDKHVSLYSFRHTVCTKLANKEGISYPWAAARMGNSLAVFMSVYVSEDRDQDSKMVKNWLK